MKWRMALSHREGVPKRRWPERMNRAVVVFAVVAVLVGTPFVSSEVFSKDLDTQTIVVEPSSYYAIHFGIYGYGSIDYHFEVTSGSPVTILQLDKTGYERFKDGLDYSYLRSVTLSHGSWGGGVSGIIWEMYFVLINNGAEPAPLEFAAESKPLASLPVAGIMLGLVAAVGYAVERHFAPPRSQEAGQIPSPTMMTPRRKAIVAAAGLFSFLATIVVLPDLMEGITTHDDISFSSFDLMVLLWYGTLMCTAVAFLLRLRLSTVRGDPEVVLASLAHRLRVSGYRVSKSPGRLSVRISTTSAIRIIAKPASEGTSISYQTTGTPAGFVILIILVLAASSLAPIQLVFAVFMLYRSSVFASDRVLPRLFGMPVPELEGGAASTRMMLVAGLSEGMRVAAEAHEATRAKYHAWALVLVFVFLIGYGQASILLSWHTGVEAWRAYRLLVGLIAGLIAAIIYWGLVSRRLGPMLKDLKVWITRLESALSREAEGVPPMDGEVSSFELVMESYGEVPKWVKARRKAGIFRRPGYWFLIFFFSLYAVGGGVGAIIFVSTNIQFGMILTAISVAFGSLASFMYLHWRKRQNEEDRATLTDQTGRLQTLRAEMETYLGSV